MGLPVRRIRLRRGERRRLERFEQTDHTATRGRKGQHRSLLCRGTVSAICREVGVSRPTVPVAPPVRGRSLKSCSRTDHARVDPTLGDRPQDPRGEARRRHALELPSQAKEVGVHPTTISPVYSPTGVLILQFDVVVLSGPLSSLSRLAFGCSPARIDAPMLQERSPSSQRFRTRLVFSTTTKHSAQGVRTGPLPFIPTSSSWLNLASSANSAAQAPLTTNASRPCL